MKTKAKQPDMKPCTQESGTCHTCQSWCRNRPGWFKPGEAEKAADLLGLTMLEFFQKYLAVDWWVGDPGPDTFVLSPAIVSSSPGTEFPADPRGRCIFYTEEGRCQIHDAKPYECRMSWCEGRREENYHQLAAESWAEYQSQIRDLLGREPHSSEPSLTDLIGWCF